MKDTTVTCGTRKRAIFFISGSAGELDWVLPILNFLLSKNFNLKIIFLTRHALKSVKQNRMCNDFITQSNPKIEILECGGYFPEKIEFISYLTYRIFLKLRLDQIYIVKQFYSLYDRIFKIFFLRNLPSEILNLRNEKHLFIMEYPSLRRPRDKWIKQNFKNSIFFYCPHSPHIYCKELDKKYGEGELDFKKNSFLLLGHPGDYQSINDDKELADESLQKVYIGHPKYSNRWLGDLQIAAKKFRSEFSLREKTSILILSRGFGSYLDESSHKKMVETTLEVINKTLPTNKILVKKHPRENPSYWNEILDNNSSVEIVNEHILQLATKADFVISFWGSGAMDCFSMGLPVIEYWNPDTHYKDQVAEGSGYTTIYRKLGIVLPANNAEELKKRINFLVSNNHEFNIKEYHPFFDELLSRSNSWDKTIKRILETHKLIDRNNL